MGYRDDLYLKLVAAARSGAPMLRAVVRREREAALVELHDLRAVAAQQDAPLVDIPLVRSIGVFDPDKLGSAPQAGAAPLSSLQPPLLTPRDDDAAARLHGRALRPNGNPGDYLPQPPGLLTALRAARPFGGELFPDFHPSRAIAAVRVRVAGVTGIDAVSRERIRQAAERIAPSTGLDVDITPGASGALTAIDLPAGKFGRPALAVN